MSKISCCRKITFEASHKLYPCETACRNIHGHSYKLFVYARNRNGNLDENGMVLDFAKLKDTVKTWIDENWDHTFIFHYTDDCAKEIIDLYPGLKNYKFTGNPTAENMSLYLLHDVCPTLFSGTNIQVFKIQLYETENCFVEVELED